MAAMQDGIREACEAVQAAAPGKDKVAVRRMLAAELQSREVFLPPELVDVLAERIAAGTYVPGEPVVSVDVQCSGLLRVPFIRKAVGSLFRPVFEEAGRQIWAGAFGDRVAEQDLGPFLSPFHPHPPGRGLHTPAPDEVPPPARMIPDPDLRERIPELFELPPLPYGPPGTPPPAGTEILAWLEDSDGMVAVCQKFGRLGILDARDAEAYLPLVRAAHAQGKVVAATAEVRRTPRDLPPATVSVIPGPDPSDPGGAK